jgi:hypothetical protein
MRIASEDHRTNEVGYRGEDLGPVRAVIPCPRWTWSPRCKKFGSVRIVNRSGTLPVNQGARRNRSMCSWHAPRFRQPGLQILQILCQLESVPRKSGPFIVTKARRRSHRLAISAIPAKRSNIAKVFAFETRYMLAGTCAVLPITETSRQRAMMQTILR